MFQLEEVRSVQLFNKPTHYLQLLGFLITERIIGIQVPDEPHMDGHSKLAFFELLKNCNFYLEYGCGGSTVFASRNRKNFISIDTDKYYLNSVKRKIGTFSEKQILLHGNIGLTGYWGIPLFKNFLGRRRKHLWKNYPELPWNKIAPGNEPDLILIDGRFRVASFLKCVLHLQNSLKSAILVDDFIDRPHYSVMKEFGDLEVQYGRMALFRPKKVNIDKLNEIAEQYSLDWR